METLTDRLPSGFTGAPAPTAAQVRADVARAVAGLEALHGDIARRRRDLEDEDRQLEDLERELTGRTPAPLEPGPNGTNGVHAGTEPVDEDDVDQLEIELGKASWDDQDPELDVAWAPVPTLRPGADLAWGRALADNPGLADDMREFGRTIRDAASEVTPTPPSPMKGEGASEARDAGQDAPTNPPDGPAAELGQEAPAPDQPGQDGRELGEARHDAAASSVALDVDEHFEAMFIESQGPGEPDDAPDEVLDLAGTVTEEMPAGGAVGVAWEPPDVDPVPDVDWRATTMQRVLSAIDGPGMLSTIAPLEDELEIARIETVGDLCEFLTDEGGELADISPNPQYRAELCRALEVFRTSQGWDESTQYPAGIPAGWFEIEEDDLAAIAAETASRPSEWKELYRTPRLKKEPPPQPRIKPTRPAATGKKDREAKKVFGEVITAAMSAAAIRATGKTAPAPKAAGPAKKNNRDVPREVVLERLKTALEPKLAKWEKLRASGAVYTTLNRAILAHLGARSGADWSSIHAAGDELKFWATKSGAAAKKKPDLAGHLAVDASREILEIGLPDGPGATPAPGAGKKAPKVAAKHEPTITAAKDEDWKANGKASETRPSVLPPGNGEKPWTLDSLKSAADSLRWKASDKSMFVCDRCNSLYLADVWKKGDPGGGAPGNPRERCPQCDGGFCRTYATEEANIRERVASVGASKKASPATELLGDKSHGFKPVKTVGKVTLAQTAPPGSLNAELARALQLEHPYHGQVWAELHRTGATDAEILAQLKRLWPNAPVFTPAEKKAAPGGYTIQGGKTLGFWHGAKKSTNQEPLLAGPMLAKSVRSLLGIREKNASKQPGAKPRASGAQRRRSAKTASPAAHIDDVPEDPGPEIHEPVVVPEPIGGWNVPAMSTAAADILGKDHRESSRDAALVCCTSCQAMRRRGPGPCSECDAPGFRSYAALRAEVLGAGKRALDEAMASDRARDRGQRG